MCRQDDRETSIFIAKPILVVALSFRGGFCFLLLQKPVQHRAHLSPPTHALARYDRPEDQVSLKPNPGFSPSLHLVHAAKSLISHFYFQILDHCEISPMFILEVTIFPQSFNSDIQVSASQQRRRRRRRLSANDNLVKKTVQSLRAQRLV